MFGMDDDGANPGMFEHTRNRYNLNTRIMLTAIVCLFSLIVAALLLHVYARYLLRRQQRRRAALRFLRTGVATTQVQLSEPQRNGLDPGVIASLPIFVYKWVNHVDESFMIECSVCLSVLQEGELARILPNCKHTFHAECVDMWLGTNSTCPVCRTDAKPDVAAQTNLPAEHGAIVVPASINSSLPCSEGTSDSTAQSLRVGASSSSRFNSFRRMLSRDKSERSRQTCAHPEGVSDIERA
ncbi:hypothetical protein GIB67_025486 [Kingdonia uniflora]|uniref:RING-type E3 ubiquitin transferase n=1 Tax=Kingdonia uniflora TaxID=39325 RepID=A0A7J7PCJ7_9MAGN|nr:hypothetical protein GIB67_025486 [Kingdonia uniflora]